MKGQTTQWPKGKVQKDKKRMTFPTCHGLVVKFTYTAYQTVWKKSPKENV
jgi:hypothetical protein